MEREWSGSGIIFIFRVDEWGGGGVFFTSSLQISNGMPLMILRTKVWSSLALNYQHVRAIQWANLFQEIIPDSNGSSKIGNGKWNGQLQCYQMVAMQSSTKILHCKRQYEMVNYQNKLLYYKRKPTFVNAMVNCHFLKYSILLSMLQTCSIYSAGTDSRLCSSVTRNLHCPHQTT